jgi:hypothetical protein
VSAADVARHVADAERCLRETEVGTSPTDNVLAWATLSLAHTALAEHYRLDGEATRCTAVVNVGDLGRQCLLSVGHAPRFPGGVGYGTAINGHVV